MKVPKELQDKITRIGGRIADGRPKFRMVWGADRLTIIGGRWNKYDDHGNKTGEYIGTKKVPKHPEAVDRWILEVWCPPENYGKEWEWREMFTENIDGQFVETMGPYPRNGEYEVVKVLEREYRDAKGVVWKKEFVPLTPTICDAIITVVKANLDLPDQIRKEAFRAQFEKSEKERDQKLADKIVSIEEKRPWWAKNDSYVVVPSDVEVKQYS